MNIYGITNIGKVRENNQDFFECYINNGYAIAIVCDGMGGGQAGNVASEIACNTIKDNLSKIDVETLTKEKIKHILIESMKEANREVFKLSKVTAGMNGMGTTAVIVIATETQVHIANVGDSRAYWLNDGKLIQATKDHSLVQNLVESGEITEQEARVHPKKNVITRAVGVELVVKIDTMSFAKQTHDKLLICTDGLTNMVTDEQIEIKLQNLNAQEACEELVELANNNGGSDNVTVVVID